jgi:hypothetical protein
MSTRRYLIFSLVGLVIISTTVIAFLNSETRLFANLPLTIAAGIALYLCLLIMHKLKLAGRYDRTHTFLTLGIGMWFVAEIVYTYYQLGLSVETPFPSLADIFYLSGYVFFGFYVYSILKLLRKTIERDLIILVSIATVVSITYMLNLSFGIAQFLTAPDELVRTILSISYFVLDGILLVPATLVLWTMRKGGLGYTHWILMSLFIIFNAIGDIGFGYGAIIGTVGEEEWIWDIFFNAGYLTLVCALFWQNKYLSSTSSITVPGNK